MKKFILSIFILINTSSYSVETTSDNNSEINKNDFKARSLSYYESFHSPDDEVITLGNQKITRSKLNSFAGINHSFNDCHGDQKASILDNTNFQNAVNISLALSSSYLVFFAEKDKLLHGIVGAVVGGGVTYLCEKIFFNGNNSLTCAIAGSVAGTALAIAKEYRDSKGFGNVEFADALATGGIAVLASFKLSFNSKGELNIRPSIKPF